MFLTITVTVDVVELPAASRAMARSVCEPFDAPVVDHVVEYGDLVSGDPKLAPSTVNCTLVTPTLSLAVARTVMPPLTVAPLSGDEMVTVGAVVSAETLLTVIVTVAELPVLPAASRATAQSVCEPFDVPVVDQLIE
jgi:hypothetical protein